MADNYQKILITGDFDFPDLTWDSNIIHTPITVFPRTYLRLFPSANEHVPDTIPQCLGPNLNKGARIHR